MAAPPRPFWAAAGPPKADLSSQPCPLHQIRLDTTAYINNPSNNPPQDRPKGLDELGLNGSFTLRPLPRYYRLIVCPNDGQLSNKGFVLKWDKVERPTPSAQIQSELKTLPRLGAASRRCRTSSHQPSVSPVLGSIADRCIPRRSAGRRPSRGSRQSSARRGTIEWFRSGSVGE